MTPREQAAFAAGIETARQMALTAAVTIEVRGDGVALHGRMHRVLHGVVGVPMPLAVRGMRLWLPSGRREHLRHAGLRDRAAPDP